VYRAKANVRFGSLADLNANVTPTAASGGKPAVRSAIFENPAPDVCFHPKQPFRSAKIQENDRLLSARSGQCSGLLSTYYTKSSNRIYRSRCGSEMGGESLFVTSTTTFQDPSVCFRQMVTYFPFVVVLAPVESSTLIAFVPNV
jgi:hypothetical protein